MQLKPVKWDGKDSFSGNEKKVTQALLVFKWGGELTHAGVD